MENDSWVPSVAFRQGGAFTRRQAVEAGCSRGQIDWRVRRGTWVPVLGTVMRHAKRPQDAFTEAYAAVLTWPDAVVALGTAARIHRLPVPHDGAVHVVVRSGRRPRGVLTPFQYHLEAGEIDDRLGVRVTTRERTIADCLGRLPTSAALDLLAWVSSRRLLDAPALERWLTSHRGLRGNRARADAARRLRRGAVNPAEDLLQHILTSAGITGWQGGVSLLEYLGIYAQVDVYFPAVKLVIEVDGRAAHGESRFQSDRTRQNELVAAGCTVLRYTWQDLTQRPQHVATEIQATLHRLMAALP